MHLLCLDADSVLLTNVTHSWHLITCESWNMNMSSLIEELKILQRCLNMAALLAAVSFAFVVLTFRKSVYRFCSLNIISVVDLAWRLLESAVWTIVGRQRAFVDAMQRRTAWGEWWGEGVGWHSQLNNWVSLRWWRSSAHHWVCVVYCSAFSATLLPSLTCSPFLFLLLSLSAMHPMQYIPVSSSRGILV